MGLVTGNSWGSGIKAEGYTPREGDRGPLRNFVGAGYFHTLGIPILAGRDFGPQDRENSPHVAIVNEKFAKFYFGTQSPIGRRIGPEGTRAPPDFVIVGVAKDGKYKNIREDALLVHTI